MLEYCILHIMPPTAANPEPMAKVKLITLLTSTAISPAVSKSLDTARMATPTFVFLTIKFTAISSRTVIIGIITVKDKNEITLL